MVRPLRLQLPRLPRQRLERAFAHAHPSVDSTWDVGRLARVAVVAVEAHLRPTRERLIRRLPVHGTRVLRAAAARGDVGERTSARVLGLYNSSVVSRSGSAAATTAPHTKSTSAISMSGFGPSLWPKNSLSEALSW